MACLVAGWLCLAGAAVAQGGVVSVPMPEGASSQELLRYVVWAIVAAMLGLGAGALMLINKLVVALLQRNSDLAPILEQMRADMARRDGESQQREREMVEVLKSTAASNVKIAEANGKLAEAVRHMDRRLETLENGEAGR